MAIFNSYVSTILWVDNKLFLWLGQSPFLPGKSTINGHVQWQITIFTGKITIFTGKITIPNR